MFNKEQKRILHLQNRFLFGPFFNQNDSLNINQIINKYLSSSNGKESLLQNNSIYDGINTKAQEVNFRKRKDFNFRKKVDLSFDTLRLKWLSAMASERDTLRLNMSLFWHDHFACSSTRPDYMLNYLNKIILHGLGSFKELLLNLAFTPAMLEYLDVQNNKKGLANENFARELLELFTLGEGNYDFRDIQEAARSFTGWAVDFKGNLVFNPKDYDNGIKTFLGKKGKFSPEDIINIILEKPECHRFIVTKIYKYYVNEEVDQSHIDKLAKVFYDSKFNIGSVIRYIISSQWFYDEKNVNNRVMNPIELLVKFKRLMNPQSNHKVATISTLQRNLGQLLFNPPSVAGWQHGYNWLNASTASLRGNMIYHLINHSPQTPSTVIKKINGINKVNFLDYTYNIEHLLEFLPSKKVEAWHYLNFVLNGNYKHNEVPIQNDLQHADFIIYAIAILTSKPEFQLN